MTTFAGNIATTEIPHRGYIVTHEDDVRGPSHDEYYEAIGIKINGSPLRGPTGVELDFSSVDDAREWIDDQLNGDAPFDDNEEHRLRVWELV
jgi:hypothetical protein